MLARHFRAKGDEVVVLSRKPAPRRVASWVGLADAPEWAKELDARGRGHQPRGAKRELPLHGRQPPGNH